MKDLDLKASQQRLKAHFGELAVKRKSAFRERPVFALEHGLGSDEISSLSEALRLQITRNTPSEEHSLLWVVYASEIGYRYSGDEYWQTFEQETPGWVKNGDRHWLRYCFLDFCEAYGGARPSGAWANHFSIICWPITHAILPRDLQRQLARILYELRHSYSKDLFESPSTLGELIAARSWDATSRFQKFVEETSLVGQIATALLLEGEPGTATRIEPQTLRRIRDDLDRERRGREWLLSARRYAKTGAAVRVFAQRKERRTSEIETAEARAHVVSLGIEPRLAVRPTDVSAHRWSVSCEIPDLSDLLVRFPELREPLTASRCVVTGAAGAPLARGRCLYGPQRVTLTKWPRAAEVLLRFEKSTPLLDLLLRTECLLRPGPIWLFHIALDGTAYELRSLKVRPNHRYILVRTDTAPQANERVRPIELDCVGAFAAQLSLPPALTPDWEETLRELGLQPAKTIEVWPAGLTPAEWDAEASGTWLSTDRPCFAIRPDHPVDVLSLTLKREGRESQLQIRKLAAGNPVFCQLPLLGVGLHKLRLTASSAAESGSNQSTELEVDIQIREPRPGRPGVTRSGPLLVYVDPPTPTLEQLWEGEAEITLNGPVGRSVACSIALHEADGASPLIQKVLPPLHLPVSARDFRNHFDKFFRNVEEVQHAFDDSRLCYLHINALELGELQLKCEREFTPLRWSTRRRGRSQIVRLTDDSGEDVNPSVFRMTFDNPMSQTPLTSASEFKAPSSGGLFVARNGASMAALIAPPTLRSLSDLACDPKMPAARRSPDAVMQALHVSALWNKAKLPGDIVSAIRRREILLRLAHHIAHLICGANWAQAEIQARSGERQFAQLKNAVSKRPEHAALPRRLEQACIALVDADSHERVAELAAIVSQFNLLAVKENLEWTCELALKLASDPGNSGSLFFRTSRPDLAWQAIFRVP
ncbi:MAG TPA: hypothetical protein VLH83_07850 [Chthoniobacterales bacterium]|nr:hypothetical protein [Chthoniobacterales bacterium]